MINIKMHQNADLKGFTLIEGFPGAGLVGPMAISYIIDKLGMKYVGHMESPDFPPLIAIHENVPMPPIRVYWSEKAKLVTILAEFAIPLSLTYELSDMIFGFAKTNGVSRIVSIGGIPNIQGAAQQSTPVQDSVPVSVFAIASNDDMKKDAIKAGLKPVGEGVATGVSALMMLKAVTSSIPDVNILIPVDPNILDPKYAELAIISLNRLINLGVDVSELDREAKEVETKIRELLKKNKALQDAHKRTSDEASGTPMYA